MFDYAAGKADWGSFGLPLEGADPSAHRAGAFMRLDAPTCGPNELLQEIRARRGDWDTCFVLGPDGALLGRHRPRRARP